MSLPNGFLDEIRDRITLSDIVGRKVVWDNRKSQPGKGDYWAPCPFHQEKSPSFHVDDRKGFYYCFGCQAKGDAITFLRELENMSFMEAVETLAGEAGMPMPARDPQAAKREEKRKTLSDVMEECVRFFRLSLKGARALHAREYLDGRDMDQATQDRFEIGFAPDDRRALIAHMQGKGIDLKALVDTGMVIAPEDRGAPYDRFRGRIMFPIRDARGRCIAFGGRALSADIPAKYLNSPETALFSKGRTLFNHGPAREASGKAERLVIAEGYMDVIALARAGISEAVAPLGTAITEDQLRLAWKMAAEPVVALDGDTAGLRAAMRLVDLAMPMLEPGKSLQFVLMPTGKDPDDVLREQGASAVRKLLSDTTPLVEMLWRNITEGRKTDTPERRAALDKELKSVLAKIGDPSLRKHYGEAIAERRRALFGGGPRDSGKGRGNNFGRFDGGNFARGRKNGGNWSKGLGAGPRDATRHSQLAHASAQDEAARRESSLLWGLINHPALLERFEVSLWDAPFQTAELDQMRMGLCDLLSDLVADGHVPAEIDRVTLIEMIEERFGENPMAFLERRGAGSAPRSIGARGSLEMAGPVLLELFSRHQAIIASQLEEREAEQELSAPDIDESVDNAPRMAASLKMKERAGMAAEEENGPGEGEQAFSRKLHGFFNQAIWEKKNRR